MYHIGILGNNGKPLSVACNELKRSVFFTPKVFTDSFSIVRELKGNSIHAMVVVTDEFKQSHIRIIQQIKKHFHELPIIVITEAPSVVAKIKLADFKKTLLLGLGEIKDMNGVLLKYINNHNVIPRLASRHKTAQPARFKIEQGRVHSAYMLDLAVDGACFRLFNKHLNKGDQVYIEVPLPDLKKTHVVQGEVVWERLEKLKNETVSSSQKVGIRFL